MLGQISFDKQQLLEDTSEDTTDYMRQQLDDLQEHFDGPGKRFDQHYYNKLNACFRKFNDTLLLKAQNQMWKGQIDYWLSNGTDFNYEGKPDHWGQKVVDDPDGAFIEYHQGKSTAIGRYGMMIYEPCNYASNIPKTPSS